MPREADLLEVAAQQLGQLLRAAVAPFGFLLKALQANPFDARADIAAQFPERFGLLLSDLAK